MLSFYRNVLFPSHKGFSLSPSLFHSKIFVWEKNARTQQTHFFFLQIPQSPQTPSRYCALTGVSRTFSSANFSSQRFPPPAATLCASRAPTGDGQRLAGWHPERGEGGTGWKQRKGSRRESRHAEHPSFLTTRGRRRRGGGGAGRGREGRGREGGGGGGGGGTHSVTRGSSSPPLVVSRRGVAVTQSPTPTHRPADPLKTHHHPVLACPLGVSPDMGSLESLPPFFRDREGPVWRTLSTPRCCRFR